MMTKMTKHLAAVAATACMLLLGGCATPLPPSTAALAPINPDYLIGPGDSVNIIVWRNPEVSMSVPVRPDGKITTPLVEDLPASGKTSTQLARDIASGKRGDCRTAYAGAGLLAPLVMLLDKKDSGCKW